MATLRVADYAAHLLAVVALLAAARHTPSLRRPAWAVLAWLALSPLRGFDRDDGRALYHLAQAAEWADHALLVAVAFAPWRLAACFFVALLAAALYHWPAPATPLYAVAQLATVAGCIVALAAEYRRARAPLPGHLAAVVLVGSELACLVVPYSLAAYLGRPVAELWDAARVVRLLTWSALAVVGWRSWCSPGSVSPCSWRRLSPRCGRHGTHEPPHVQRVRYWPRSGQRSSSESGAASAGPG